METVTTLTMNPTLDKSTSIDHVVPEHKLRCQALRCEPGGGGLNVSRAIQKLGGASTALYTAGGAAGQQLRDLLEKEEIAHQPISVKDSTREGLTVFEESTKQQYRFNLPGPELQEAEWQRCFDTLAGLEPQPRYLVCSGSLPSGVPDNFYARVAKLAKQWHSYFILDTSSTDALRLALQEGVFAIKPNLREFRQLMDSELKTEQEQETAAMKLVEEGRGQVVIVSLGAAGVLLAFEDGCRRLRAPTVQIRSKVGAGDSTVAGFVLSLARGNSVLDAVRFGVAAGAAAVMTPGTELCRLEDTEQLYESISTEN